MRFLILVILFLLSTSLWSQVQKETLSLEERNVVNYLKKMSDSTYYWGTVDFSSYCDGGYPSYPSSSLNLFSPLDGARRLTIQTLGNCCAFNLASSRQKKHCEQQKETDSVECPRLDSCRTQVCTCEQHGYGNIEPSINKQSKVLTLHKQNGKTTIDCSSFYSASMALSGLRMYPYSDTPTVNGKTQDYWNYGEKFKGTEMWSGLLWNRSTTALHKMSRTYPKRSCLKALDYSDFEQSDYFLEEGDALNYEDQREGKMGHVVMVKKIYNKEDPFGVNQLIRVSEADIKEIQNSSTPEKTLYYKAVKKCQAVDPARFKFDIIHSSGGRGINVGEAKEVFNLPGSYQRTQMIDLAQRACRMKYFKEFEQNLLDGILYPAPVISLTSPVKFSGKVEFLNDILPVAASSPVVLNTLKEQLLQLRRDNQYFHFALNENILMQIDRALGIVKQLELAQELKQKSLEKYRPYLSTNSSKNAQVIRHATKLKDFDPGMKKNCLINKEEIPKLEQDDWIKRKCS